MAVIQNSLNKNSSLKAHVKSGLQAVDASHMTHISPNIRKSFGDSIDIDDAFQPAHPQSNRWDYLLGHTDTDKIFGLEPHSAGDGEISVIIQKRKSSLEHLAGHLKSGKVVADWFWVASGKVDFTSIDKARIRLENNGIEFVGRQLLKKHFPND